MVSRQQRIQEERERQQKEAAARRQLPDRPLGAEAIDAIEQDIATFTQLPGVRQTLNFVGGAVNLVDQAVLEPARYAATDPSQAGTPMALAGTAIIAGEGLMDKSAEGGAKIAERFGVDPRIGGFVGGAAAETLLTAGFGTAGRKLTQAIDRLPPPGAGPQLATVMAGGSAPVKATQPRLTIENGVAKLTLKDPDNIPEGITKGSAASPEWVPQVREYQKRRAAMKERLQSAASDKKRRQYREEAYNEMSTGPSRDPEANPEAYGSRVVFQQFKEQSQVNPLTKMGNTNWKQQHHLFPKQESYQFVERMVELGDDDDVLALFIMAEDMDATLGGRLKNMLNMEDRPHNVLHSSRIKDGRQLKSIEMANLVENAKSTDELMRLFRQYVTDNVLPSKDEAIAISKIGDRLFEMKKYKYLDELYDKNLIRKPVL